MGSSSSSNGSVAILDVQNALKVLEKNCTNSDKVPSIYYVSNFRGEGGGHSRSKQRTDQRVLVFTLKFLALKKLVFPRTKFFPNFFLTFVYLYSMQLFSADPTIFSKKI